MTKFIFDLDGTITKEETLPLISQKFQIQDKINELTLNTVKGNVPFIESFIKRVHLLGLLPIDEISKLLETVSLYDQVVNFINLNSDKCIIATGNLECWVDGLLKKIGCDYDCSYAEVHNNKVVKLKKILKKEELVKYYKNLGYKIVFIGDGNNDVEAMRMSDISIASGLTHYPANSVLSVADYLVFSEEALCRQLNQLL
ncbi:TPA: HAD-IB family phosphatase [Campylobacter jejuni]|uniref:HAD-IB family phosphatase n=1 Tax=Campylobacter jejuni TaxID=197 RepID=UPI000F7FDBD8|nr:HAD-IB family phosphatase [Campylobacter jejuni]EAK7840898.1 phosphoserine phosphatase [Campylobacter jejuni]RTJ75842.1 phosphoserine phosphatase [Campylobacter jejuni]HEF3189137.1 HAD-IB family phosphatase [Campylobacter jejuni]HEF3792066.1 HAD-IB family phosphatase [Campylobacter jejuni]HEG3724247.1 HAD-IB family phosphatase [Campylobacter jejuni]